MKLAPILDKDYPLFSWDDHPKSRDALVPGTPVEQFQTTCWSSMVRKMHDALDAMGITWEHPPYFYQGESKYFTAVKCYNLYYLCRFFVPLAAYEYTFRYEIGNIARGEYLTVRHLTFLAEWLNKFLKLARGTDSFAIIAVRQASLLHSEVAASLANLVPITSKTFGDNVSRTTADVSLDWLRTTPAAAGYIGKSQSIATMNLSSPEQPAVGKIVHSSSRVYPVRRNVVTGKAILSGESNINADFAVLPSVHGFQAGYNSRTSAKLLISMIKLVSVITRDISATRTDVDLAVVLPTAMKASATGWSASTAACSVKPMFMIDGASTIGRSTTVAAMSYKGSSAHVITDLMSRTLRDASMVAAKILEASTQIISRTRQDAAANTPSAVSAACDAKIYSKQNAKVITQTSRPMWTNYTTNTITSADFVSDTAVQIQAGGNSFTNKVCDIDIIRFAYVQENTKAFSKTRSEAIVWAQTTQPDSRTLRIRQTHRRPAKIGSALYLDCWPDQGITDDGTLVLKKIYDTVVQVEETLYIGISQE